MLIVLRCQGFFRSQTPAAIVEDERLIGFVSQN